MANMEPTDSALNSFVSVPEMIASGEMVFYGINAPDDEEEFERWIDGAAFRGHVSPSGEISGITVSHDGAVGDPVDISDRLYHFLDNQ